MTRGIIEDTRSTRKRRRELNTGGNVLTGVKDKDGNLVTKRGKMKNAITDFYKKLYRKQQENNDEGSKNN